MLDLEFTAGDLAYTRFAVSPLWEAIASLRVLAFPGDHALHHPWLDSVRPRLAAARLDLSPVLRLVTHKSIAAYICPPPVTPTPDLELELTGLRGQPVDLIFSDLDLLGIPRYRNPAAAVDLVARTIGAYWQVALAPYWPRIKTILDTDIRYRAQLLAAGGARRLFADLDPRVSWADQRLALGLRHRSGTVPLDGRGLLLTPSVFAWPRIFALTAPGWQPLLRYPARGAGTAWERTGHAAPDALAGVLGRSRALLLRLLDEPATTSDLAEPAAITPGGVSQHLTALRDAGLVSAHRIGRHVLYARTETAEALLGAAATDPQPGPAARPATGEHNAPLSHVETGSASPSEPVPRDFSEIS